MDPFDPDTIIHVLSRCEACQLGQVGTRVCVEKGHMATVASVKRSTHGNNFVDPYTEEEVDARYRLMLKPGEHLTILRTNAVIDGAVKFAPGTVFQQPPNTKSQTLLGCLKQGIPLHDFVLGGGGGSGASAAALKRGGDVEDERERGVRRQTSSPSASAPSKKPPVAPVVTAKKPPVSNSERAATSGLSGIPSQYFSRAEIDEAEAGEEDSALAGASRSGKRQGTRSSTVRDQSQQGGAGADGPDSATQLEMLAQAEGELRRSFEAHIQYLDEAEKAKREEMAAFQRAGELALQNIDKSRQATKEDGLRQHKAFSHQRQRITRLRMQEVDQERARNQLESERREAKLKAEKEALSRACAAEAEELGNAWAMVEAAAGFSPSEGDVDGGGGSNEGGKMQQLAAAAPGVGVKEEAVGGEGSGGSSGAGGAAENGKADGANGDSMGQ
ncbi:unnamed protein product [Ascophyllum nodosum]